MDGTQIDISAGDDAMARKLAALAHPVRLRILRQLGSADSCCVKDLVGRAGLAQSTVSQHLKILLEADLVSFRPEQQRSRYTINASALRDLAGVISLTVDHCCAGHCPQAVRGALPDLTGRQDAGARPTGHKDI